jgi:hypothetical protein
MAGPTSKSAWTGFERAIALKDWDSTRNPLSGANNRSDDGSARPGDVIMPKGVNAIVEAKYRASHAHHTLFDAARIDASKHKRKHAILYTKVKREQGWLVVLDGALFSQLIRIPEVLELLK